MLNILYHQTEKAKDQQRINHLKLIKNEYIMDDICYPVSFDDIDIFEKIIQI